MITNSGKFILLISIAFLLQFCAGPSPKAVKKQQEKFYKIDTQFIHLDSLNKLIPIHDSLVIPTVYDTLIVSHFITSDERKTQFINQILPSILLVKFNLNQQIQKVEYIIKLDSTVGLCQYQQNYLDSLINKFRANSANDLLVRMKPHPTSLVLAQAIVESGWGTSRFATEGNNLFGIWTTANDPDVIKSLYDRAEQKIYVKKYNNVSESISHYFLTLGRHSAYKQFRNLRDQNVGLEGLIKSLNLYSEMGEDYTVLLDKIVEWNDLQQYDSYKLDPNYIIEDKASELKLFEPCDNKINHNELEIHRSKK